jgi:hypothetical protein
MKSHLLILLCSLVLPHSVKADWTIVQKSETSTSMMHQTNNITLKIKGNKTRTDSGPFTSVIRDNDTGDQIILMHPQKRYMVQSASQMKEGMEMIKQMSPQADNSLENIPKLLPTGKTEKINGYDTEEFVWEGAVTKSCYWVAKDFPNYASLRDAMEKRFSDVRKLTSHPLPDMKSLPGIVVRSENVSTMTMKAPPGLTPEQARQSGFGQSQMHTNTMTLVSAKEETLSDSEFTVPADYKGVGSTTPVPSTNSAAGLRDVLKAMEKQGLSEADRKAFEKIVKDAEAKPAKNGK